MYPTIEISTESTAMMVAVLRAAMSDARRAQAKRKAAAKRIAKLRAQLDKECESASYREIELAIASKVIEQVRTKMGDSFVQHFFPMAGMEE